MTLPTSSLKTPQTAADLLEGLLRSRLFAESICGQIVEQSSLYLDHQAGEYASTLVQKRVLTAWQARQLLKGRTGFYAGTFRLLERLTSDPGRSLFIAEQSGPQRLVLLQVQQSLHDLNPAGSACVISEKPIHSSILRCIEVQHTPALRLFAYEFCEALPLGALLEIKSPTPNQKADLLRQFAIAVESVSDSSLPWLALNSALLDSDGQLRLLAELNAADDRTHRSEAELVRVADEMAAVHRFAAQLGDFPEIEGCHSPGEVHHTLSEFAEPWQDAFSLESLRCPRSLMNRYLRKGPALRTIEEFASEQQVVMTQWQTSDQFQLAATTEPDVTPADSMASPTPSPVPHPTEPEKPVRTASQMVKLNSGPKRRVRSVNRLAVMTALAGAILAGVLLAQWIMRWDIRRAKAASEKPVEVCPQ